MTAVRIVRHCPWTIMQSNGESVDPGVGYLLDVPEHVAALLARTGYAEPEMDSQ